ncbi:MAG: TlpA disulfide reductase family protein [Candidatus Omnitrophota bacterium]|nr:TlpA disulfide reductase family protein [Candidatus Omnitrophota bacterium]
MIRGFLSVILIFSFLTTGYSKGQWGDAPDFTLPGLRGENFTLSSLKNKVVILDFWAVGCPPCRKEIPGFIELYSKYKDEGLEIVGVCLDGRGRVKPFAEQKGIDYILVFADREVCRQYGGIRYIPTTFIIDRRGNIAKRHIGYASKETFEEEIKELLSREVE